MLKCLPEYARGLPGVVARFRAWLDAPVPPGTQLPLSRAACFSLLHFAPHPAAVPRPPCVTLPAWVTSGDDEELAAASGHGYSCRLRHPVLCPEMLFIPWGGSTNAPRFGDFSSLVAIGAYLDPGPCQKATEMFYGICWGFMSPPAHILALLSSGSRQSGQGAGMWKGFNHLTTIPCLPMCPLPTAALGEPDQHGSAGELRQ